MSEVIPNVLREVEQLAHEPLHPRPQFLLRRRSKITFPKGGISYNVIMANPAMISTVREKYEALAPLLHEKARRCWAAGEAIAWARWHLARRRGHRAVAPDDPSRYRRTPGRRHRPGDRADHPGFAGLEVAGLALGDRSDLLRDLKRLIDPATRGDPMSPLLWTCKSTRNRPMRWASWGMT